MGNVCQARRSIKPFIFWVEFGQHDDQHLHFANRSVPRARSNHHAHAWMHIDQLFIQLHLGIRRTFEEVVGFRQPLVIVQTSFGRDLGDVNRAREISDVGKRSPRASTRTRNPRDLGEIRYFVTTLDDFGVHRVRARWGCQGGYIGCERSLKNSPP